MAPHGSKLDGRGGRNEIGNGMVNQNPGHKYYSQDRKVTRSAGQAVKGSRDLPLVLLPGLKWCGRPRCRVGD